MDTSETSRPKDFYVWEPPGKGVSIFLGYDVIDQLLQEAMQGLGAVPKRGVEIGGVLLGTVESANPLAVRIEGIKTVKCEYASGPSYCLSGNDTPALEAALGEYRPAPDRRIYAVGFFRSHTRPGLSLSDDDLALCARYFPNPTEVVLLIRPFVSHTSLGGFFFRQDGGFTREPSPLEFPFSRRELGGGEPAPRVRRRSRGEEAEERAAPVEVEAPRDQPPIPPFLMPAPKRPLGFRKWAILAAVFLMLGGLLGFVATPYFRQRGWAPAPANPYAFGLSAAQKGGDLHIKWNRQSPLFQVARGGRITIVDDGSTRMLEMDLRQLQTGAGIIYRKISNQVDIRMEVFVDNQASVVEDVEVKTSEP
jgi:hypothetical protein